jgi:hypothetical protein
MRALRHIFERQLTPQRVIDQLKQSGLLGRGGAAFPTWIKWEGALKAPNTPKYFVINADESEPGTFKDRILMEGDPCRIIEGAIIGAYTISAQHAYLYIRGEYPRAIECMQHAVEESGSRLSGPQHPRFRLRSRSGNSIGRGRVHLRRGDGVVRINRGQARLSAHEAALPRDARFIRSTDGDQQRRNTGEDSVHLHARR